MSQNSHPLRFTSKSAEAEQEFVKHQVANNGWVVEGAAKFDYSGGLATEEGDGITVLIFDCGLMTTIDSGYFDVYFEPVF